MITADNMFEGILASSPSFHPIWQKFIDNWEGDGDLPLYLLLGDLAFYLVVLLEEGKETEIKNIFKVVETWHLQGNHYVKEAAIVGLLEDLQNTNFHKKTTKPEDFLPYMLPETKFWWNKVTDFWEKRILIQDDR